MGAGLDGAFILITLKWYKFKLVCYNLGMSNLIHIVNTKKIAIWYTQKEMRRELKFHYKKNPLNTKDNTGNKGQESYAHWKQRVKWQKSLLIINYFKYKQFKFSNQDRGWKNGSK